MSVLVLFIHFATDVKIQNLYVINGRKEKEIRGYDLK